MTAWRHFNPKPVKAWNVEALAQCTPDAVKESPERRDTASIQDQRRREGTSPSDLEPGRFVRVDYRWYRVVRRIHRGNRRGTHFEIEDIYHPEVRHVVSWSEISHVAIPEEGGSRTNSEGT